VVILLIMVPVFHIVIKNLYKITDKLVTVPRAVPWLRRLVAGHSPRRPAGFDPGSVHVGFVVDKWHWDRFSPSTSVFPCQFHSTGAPLLGKTKKNTIIFITGLQNKPQGCGASVASAAVRP
jgi:hypothetical protein